MQMEVKIFNVSFLFVRNQCYLIHKNNEGILIDPAWNYRLIRTFLESNRVTLKGVLLTHGHLDHINLAGRFAKAYDIPVFMNDKEIEASGFKCKNLTSVSHLKELEVSGIRILPILTPGHTPGSTCFLIGDNLFSGDTVFIEGVGRCYDAGIMYSSIQFLKYYLNENVRVWPGHSFGESPGQRFGHLLTNNIYFQLDKKEHFIALRTRRKQSRL